MEIKRRTCSRCVCDTSIPGILFDAHGICSFCKAHDKLEKTFPLGVLGQSRLSKLVRDIKANGKGKLFDCVVGVSGGADSTYCLYIAKELGLRPLAIHLDNGWNSKTAVVNIQAATTKLRIPLEVITCNWREFRSLQIAFLEASVSDAEIPTDLAILSVLYRIASKNDVKYILNGHSFRVEGLSPTGWTYMDGAYIRSVQAKYGTMPLVDYPNLSIKDLMTYSLVKRIKFVPLLVYLDYNKERSKKTLSTELGWIDYGGHHFESDYTHFVITNVLWQKFAIDKRIIEYSAKIRSSQITRDEALKNLKEPPSEDLVLNNICIAKLGLSRAEFARIMIKPPNTFLDYRTYFRVIRCFKIPIWLACKLGILPQIFYEKYQNWDYKKLRTHYYINNK